MYVFAEMCNSLNNLLQEEVYTSTDGMINCAYVSVGTKAQELYSGRKVLFPMSRIKKKSAPTSQTSCNTSLNQQLEGQLGQIQKNCYRKLIDECKAIATEMGANQWTTIMSVQVCIEFF